MNGLIPTLGQLRSPLSRRLIYAIVLVSSMLTLLLTSLQLYSEYRSELREIGAEFQQVEDVHLKVLTQSVWTTDLADLRLQLEGTARLPNMEYVAVHEDGKLLQEAGRRKSRDTLERKYAMRQPFRGQVIEIGTLTVVAGLDGVYGALLARSAVILASNALKTFFVAVFALLFFHWLVTRHLDSIAAHLRDLEVGAPVSTFTLARRPAGAPDELDNIVAMINRLQQRTYSMLAALLSSEERFRNLTDLSADWYWEQDATFRFTTVSDGWARGGGVPKDTVIGRCRWEIAGLVPLSSSWEAHRATLEAHRAFEDFEFLAGEGDAVQYFSVSGEPVFDERGVFAGYRGVARNVTARTLGARALLESELRYRNLIETSHDLVWILDGKGCITFVNEASRRVLGREPAEMIGRHYLEFVPAELRELEKANFAALLRSGGDLANHEMRFEHKGGSHVMLSSNARVRRDPDGRIVEATGSSRDVTEERSREAALHESERRYRELFDFSPVPIYVFDRESLQIIAANTRMQSQYGWWREELLGMRLPDLYPRAASAEALAGARSVGPVRRHQRKNGQVFEVEETAQDITYYDRPARLVSPIDVSDRERTERMLRETAENLQAISHRLVSVQEDERRAISCELHDRIGQNLTALGVNLATLHATIGRASPEETEHRFRDSFDLLASTSVSIENVMAELRPQMLDDYGLGAALRWYGQQFQERTGVCVQVRVAAHAPANRQVRDMALFRIAQEALNNIAKHASARSVEIDLSHDAADVTLALRDDGRGFDAKQRLRGQQRLGMRTMQERAAAVGGKVAIESVVGRGTTLNVRVPLWPR